MLKKIILVIFSFVFIQNMLMAQEKTINDAYLLRLQNKVKNNWIIQQSTKGDKSSVVLFTINPDGAIIDAQLLRSSGDTKFDKSSLLAIYKSVPFEKFSAETNDVENADKNNVKLEFFFGPNITSVNKVDENLDITMDKPQMTEYGPYLFDLDQRIKSNWHSSIYFADRNAVVLFKVRKDGSIEDLQLIKSSTDNKFDTEALKTVNASVPFDSLPTSSKEDFIQIQYSFLYNLLKDDNSKHYNSICLLVNTKTTFAKDTSDYKKQVEKVLAYYVPKDRYYKNLKIKLKITVTKSGDVLCLNVLKSSGDKKFDNKIIATYKKCSFPTIPSTLNKNQYTFDYSIKTQNLSSSDIATDVVWLGSKKLIPAGLVWY